MIATRVSRAPALIKMSRFITKRGGVPRRRLHTGGAAAGEKGGGTEPPRRAVDRPRQARRGFPRMEAEERAIDSMHRNGAAVRVRVAP
jgi:hypothetical protein